MKKLLIVFLLFILAVPLTMAQVRTISGMVTAGDDGSTLPGVTVVAVGSTIGTTTNFDGVYEIDVPADVTVLRFSFIGYATQDVEIGNQAEINVVLPTSFTNLDEVVVIGYGTATKESLTGAVEVIRSEQFEMKPIATLQGSLQGAATGLQMTASDGQPGANAQVRIRGVGSINASSEPLYVVDGIPVQTGSLGVTDNTNGGRSTNVMASLNPNDIASVTVLKDASATAIYGSRAANGVILITTKQGKSGVSKIDFSTSVGVSSGAYKHLFQPLNRDQYHELFIEGYVNGGEDVATAQARYDNWFPEPADTDWLDEITQQGITQQYNLSASGGNDVMTYFASASYYDQDGYLVGTNFNRLSSRLNLTAKLSDKLSFANNLTVSRTKTVGTSDGSAWDNPMYGAYLVAPQIPVYDEEGLFYADHKDFSYMGGANPLGRLTVDERWMKQTRIIDNLSATYEIIEGLKFKTAWSIDMINISEFEYQNGRFGDGRRVGGTGNEGTIENINWIGTQTLNYNTVFNSVHNFDAIVGYEAQHSDRRSMEIWGETYPNPTLRTLASAAVMSSLTSYASQYSFVSMFSRFSYDFDRKYYATFSFRRDGSSRFGTENRWGNFWSAGVAWEASKEDFMSSLTWLDNLKIRASYGVTGNAAIDNFASLALYGFGRDYSSEPGSAPTSIGNPLLTWEGQQTLDVGFDISLFNRFDATVTYFHRANTDLLLERPLSMTTGFEANTQNVGDMLNTGMEIELSGAIISGGDFNWDLGVNITTLKNEITRLDEPIVDDPFRREQGRDYYEFFMWHWAGVDNSNGDPLWYTDKTETATTSVNADADRYYTGKSAIPKFFGGANTSLSYKGITLSAQAVVVWDKWFYDQNGFVVTGDGRYTPRSQPTYIYENRWTTPGVDALAPYFEWGNSSRSNQKYQTRYLYDGTHIRLRDVTLSYDLPREIVSKINVNSLRVFLQGTNMLTWVRDTNTPYDPEGEVDGTISGMQPQVKTMSIGLNASF